MSIYKTMAATAKRLLSSYGAIFVFNIEASTSVNNITGEASSTYIKEENIGIIVNKTSFKVTSNDLLNSLVTKSDLIMYAQSSTLLDSPGTQFNVIVDNIMYTPLQAQPVRPDGIGENTVIYMIFLKKA